MGPVSQAHVRGGDVVRRLVRHDPAQRGENDAVAGARTLEDIQSEHACRRRHSKDDSGYVRAVTVGVERAVIGSEVLHVGHPAGGGRRVHPSAAEDRLQVINTGIKDCHRRSRTCVSGELRGRLVDQGKAAPELQFQLPVGPNRLYPRCAKHRCQGCRGVEPPELDWEVVVVLQHLACGCSLVARWQGRRLGLRQFRGQIRDRTRVVESHAAGPRPRPHAPQSTGLVENHQGVRGLPRAQRVSHFRVQPAAGYSCIYLGRRVHALPDRRRRQQSNRRCGQAQGRQCRPSPSGLRRKPMAGPDPPPAHSFAPGRPRRSKPRHHQGMILWG